VIRGIRAEGRGVVWGPFGFLFQQLGEVDLVAGVVWLAGLFALLFWRPLRPYRVLGWSYLVSYMVIYLQHGKNYYLAPIYPMLFAAGAVAIDCFVAKSPSRRGWLKRVIAIAIIVTGIYRMQITF